MLRPWNQNDGILIEANVTFGLHVVYANNTFVVAYSDNNGKLNVVWVKKDDLVNLVSALQQGRRTQVNDGNTGFTEIQPSKSWTRTKPRFVTTVNG